MAFSSIALGAEPTSTLEIDVLGGGLARAAILISGRVGTSITYEGVPRTLEGINIAHDVDARGVAHPRMIYPHLRFSYPATSSPEQAAQAALDAWNAMAVDAHYKLVVAGPVLHFVPTEARTPAGTYVPFAPVMDTPIHLDRTTGTPTDLYHDAFAKLVEASGVPIDDDMEGLVGFVHPHEPDDNDWYVQQSDITLPRSDGTARELMSDILVAANRETGWMLNWTVGGNGGRGGFGFLFTLATPRDELLFNGTPIVPAPR